MSRQTGDVSDSGSVSLLHKVKSSCQGWPRRKTNVKNVTFTQYAKHQTPGVFRLHRGEREEKRERKKKSQHLDYRCAKKRKRSVDPASRKVGKKKGDQIVLVESVTENTFWKCENDDVGLTS